MIFYTEIIKRNTVQVNVFLYKNLFIILLDKFVKRDSSFLLINRSIIYV